MGIHVALQHRTEYRYERAVSLGPQVIQLRPAPHCRTPILEYLLSVTPANHILHWQFDPLANHLARVIFPEKTDILSVEVNLVADLTPYNPFGFFLEPGFETFPFQYPAELARDLEPYRVADEPGPKLEMFLATLPRQPQPTVSFLVDLNGRVRDAVGYRTRLEHGVQSCEETLTGLTGSCRDSAWLLVQVFRRLGVAARFVSGYLIQLAADDPAQGGPKEDNADLHAWAEVYLPGAGWIGLDPTSGLLTAEGHIPLVCTPTAHQAAPISGTAEPAEVDFSFAMAVKRLGGESRQVAKKTAMEESVPQEALTETNIETPYSETEWDRIRQAAHDLDRSIEKQDIRLTMGGEPTYVGTDDPESLQWSVAALGEAKRTAGLSLLRSLRKRTAPGGLLHFGQGKWYPGEELPRWAFHCVSRRDGVPVWENADLFAREEDERGYGLEETFKFMTALTRRLGAWTEDIIPGYDAADDNVPVGYVLPLRRRQPNGVLAWSSQPWFERPERLVLSYGDSPIGYRIPVAAMPFVAPDELEYEVVDGIEPKDERPLTEKVRLPAGPARLPERFGKEPKPDPLPPLASTAETATELIRPALCVQARDGRLHIFVPYVAVLADYLDLVAGIEETAQHVGVKIWIEGYPAPMDRRAVVYSLTPDPGVLEVNLPPTDNWDDLEELNAVLADEAGKNRLVAGKFAYDGTHLATGGGYHIVLGAKTVPDSPVLRRPDLLRSMVAFWQNHPSLSYLFAGMYVGPTSQYPRVDEARSDALYELEVSFSQLPNEASPAYIVDGLFRNLLVDVTGNTHRAEFCIDKMYPPEGQGLRAGLLELRAFEMAPHYRMNLTQMLLVRALVCTFWKQPFTGGLLRWGAALHDRYMLPHFIRQDFAEVLEHGRAAGFKLEDVWFAPQLEFRFPTIGTMSIEGVTFELRQALEPWNVLAEETSSGRTGRSVDSSLERLQVKLTGAADGRYVVACNGRRVPLHSTGAAGESIAGIRYRARRLSAALHPTVPVHTPLAFDLIDTLQGRAVARCTYYAGRPDGELYSGRPADAAEAKTRRMERFQVSAPPADGMQAPPEETNPVFPMTLDLRWPAPKVTGTTE
jgi:uncharacterized protein (DUF2126 family)/transglutaminase-like putative cysteine protease